MKRSLGRSGIEVSALGMGCWAIGGPFYNAEGQPVGWGEVDDSESIYAVHAALDHGITFFDTADVYGAGHSEEVLGKALGNRRHKMVVATKFGNRFDPATKTMSGQDSSPAYIRTALEASLKRLETDYIDLYQIHEWGLDPAAAGDTLDELDRLVEEGKIRAYGWSTDDMERVRLIASRRNCAAIQNALNLFKYDPELQKLCVDENLASINRSPLAMGLLSGKYSRSAGFDGADIRSGSLDWMSYFKDGKPNGEFLQILEKVRELLTLDGRSLVQGALGWIWAVSNVTVPIPGIRTAAQATENARAMEFGPLPQDTAEEITRIILP